MNITFHIFSRLKPINDYEEACSAHDECKLLHEIHNNALHREREYFNIGLSIATSLIQRFSSADEERYAATWALSNHN